MSETSETPNEPQATTALEPAGASPDTGVVKVSARWRIPVDVVTKGTESLPESQRDQLRWIGRYGAQGNYSLAEIAAMLKKPSGESYSGDSLYAALTGRRTEQGVNLAPMAEAIAQFRRRTEETSAVGSKLFVETRISRQITAMCDRARRKGRLAFIFGPTQVGKTAVLAEYARTHNHGQTYLVRMPTRGSMSHFLNELATVLRLPTGKREDTLRRRILNAFDPSILLIVDEAHHTLFGQGPTTGMTLEFLREIHDRRKCGVVVCGTEVLRTSIQHSGLLRQLWERRTPSLVLSLNHASYSHADLAEFARAYGLDPAPDRTITIRNTLTGADGSEQSVTYRENPVELQARVVAGSLGAWIKTLEDAQDWAEVQGKGITWAHVVQAYCVGKAQEGGAL